MIRRHLLPLAILAAGALACSGSDSPTGGNNGNGNGNGNNGYNNATGVMTATIDGTGWTANFLTQASFTSGTLSITGENYDGNPAHARVITFAVVNVSQPATFTLSTPGDGHGGNGIMTLGGSNQWYTSSPGGSGSLVVTALDGTHVAGTFSFVGVGAGSLGNSTVTNGHFDIPF